MKKVTVDDLKNKAEVSEEEMKQVTGGTGTKETVNKITGLIEDSKDDLGSRLPDRGVKGGDTDMADD